MAMFGMTDALKSQLIQEVYRRPLIWKVTDPKYTDVPARWLAFEEIANAMSSDEITFSSDMIKVSWKNMMDYHNQIRRRHDRAAAAGVPAPASKWQFYEMMQFTRQNKPPVKRKYNWMEPSKIPRGENETFIDSNYTHPLNGDSVITAPRSGNEPAPKKLLRRCSSTSDAGNTVRNKGAKGRGRGVAVSSNQEENSGSGMTEPCTTTRRTRKEGLRQAPKKSTRFIKEEFVVDNEVTDYQEVSSSRSPLSNSVAGAVKNRGRSRKKENNLSFSSQEQEHKRNSSEVLNSPQKGNLMSPKKQVFSPIDPNSVDDTAFSSEKSFEHQLIARLYTLKARSENLYIQACDAVKDVLTRYETPNGDYNLSRKGMKK